MIKFLCEQCGQKIGVDDDKAGRAVRCPRCKLACEVPERLQSFGPQADGNPSEAVEDASHARNEEHYRPTAPTGVPNQRSSPCHWGCGMNHGPTRTCHPPKL